IYFDTFNVRGSSEEELQLTGYAPTVKPGFRLTIKRHPIVKPGFLLPTTKRRPPIKLKFLPAMKRPVNLIDMSSDEFVKRVDQFVKK
ncbi:hypothetical protein A2U01_0011778, partial [Trifolium medium]|nr:hypothetical protein [Trifolium medium]